jgi:hypothetical protein
VEQYFPSSVVGFGRVMDKIWSFKKKSPADGWGSKTRFVRLEMLNSTCLQLPPVDIVSIREAGNPIRNYHQSQVGNLINRDHHVDIPYDFLFIFYDVL